MINQGCDISDAGSIVAIVVSILNIDVWGILGQQIIDEGGYIADAQNAIHIHVTRHNLNGITDDMCEILPIRRGLIGGKRWGGNMECTRVIGKRFVVTCGRYRRMAIHLWRLDIHAFNSGDVAIDVHNDRSGNIDCIPAPFSFTG